MEQIMLVVITAVLAVSVGWLLAANKFKAETSQITLKLEREKSLLQAEIATITADNKALADKLKANKEEIAEVKTQLKLEFEVLANNILDAKSEKFTQLNMLNLKNILEPLDKNIAEFKKQVGETYDKEAKERFSLGQKVEELAKLNQVISEEAKNLTRALKSDAKVQGNWGEMILETILEKSGLHKGEQYFMEYQLEDQTGNALRSDSSGKKMRPDAVVKYPDNRTVIIDAKVSLNAFTRLVNAEDEQEKQIETNNHLQAIRNHIETLSKKGYDDYDKSLDFVVMFIPSEPAYITAMQADAELWNYAYKKRILLLNPTNLITALKLVNDLWKREYQNRNALAIADRGAKLYDKFVGFVEDVEKVGKSIDLAKNSYNDAYNKLADGKGNLISQAQTLKELGVKSKKELPQ